MKPSYPNWKIIRKSDKTHPIFDGSVDSSRAVVITSYLSLTIHYGPSTPFNIELFSSLPILKMPQKCKTSSSLYNEQSFMPDTCQLSPSLDIFATPLHVRGGTPRIRQCHAKLEVIRKLNFSDVQLHLILGEMQSSGSLILDEHPEYVRQFVKEDWLTEPEAAQVLWDGV
ncbi:hypothetical protein FQN53_004791 [Emmonsiellopsis sp. PD_33]|nr:hypothetical protein FQN53_004791 [Emmonsiellopsis sp. PD_33]